jgi:hypothetical protein
MVAQSFTSEHTEQNARPHLRARQNPPSPKITAAPLRFDTTPPGQAGSAPLRKRQPSQHHQSGYAAWHKSPMPSVSRAPVGRYAMGVSPVKITIRFRCPSCIGNLPGATLSYNRQ